MKKLLILAGPSAVGKTTLAEFIIEGGAPAELVRSATTRAPRGDGHDGEYIYLTAYEFVKSAKEDGMLEYTEYAGNLYGTPKSEIERISEEGNIPLLILDIDGVDSIKSRKDYDSLAVYLYDDINTLEERLYKRYLGDSPTAEGLARFVSRKERNLAEFTDIENTTASFDMIVCNADLDKACREIFSAYKNGVPENAKITAVKTVRSMLEKHAEPE